jgi:uncharacterized membrane protein YeiB
MRSDVPKQFKSETEKELSQVAAATTKNVLSWTFILAIVF